MPGDSYTLREVAELLGVSKRTLQRRIKEGAFPGRYLAPGRHGLETRIPAEDVRRVLEDLRRGPSQSMVAAPAATVTPSRELGESLVPFVSSVPATALTQSDLESLRDAMIAIVREDRETFVSTVQDALVSRDRELAAVRGQLAGLQSAFERLRTRLEETFAAAPKPREAAPGNGAPDTFDVDHVMNEIDEIERLLANLGQ